MRLPRREGTRPPRLGCVVYLLSTDEEINVTDVSVQVAEKYIEALGKMAKASTTVVVPANVADASSMVTQAMAVYATISNNNNSSASNSSHSNPATTARSLLPSVKDELPPATRP